MLYHIFFLFTAPVPDKDKAGNTANTIEYEEVSANTTNVYETTIRSADSHVYEGFGEMTEKTCYQNIAK